MPGKPAVEAPYASSSVNIPGHLSGRSCFHIDVFVGRHQPSLHNEFRLRGNLCKLKGTGKTGNKCPGRKTGEERGGCVDGEEARVGRYSDITGVFSGVTRWW